MRSNITRWGRMKRFAIVMSILPLLAFVTTATASATITGKYRTTIATPAVSCRNVDAELQEEGKGTVTWDGQLSTPLTFTFKGSTFTAPGGAGYVCATVGTYRIHLAGKHLHSQSSMTRARNRARTSVSLDTSGPTGLTKEQLAQTASSFSSRLIRLGRVSRTGFRGDLDSRMLSWGEEILRCHVETEEVPRGAARAWRPVGARERPADRARRRDLGIHSETLRKRVRQVEADQGLRPDLPTSEEREEIKRLRQENFELRRANEILKSASVFFAKELDPDRPR